jgi:hypothetical protein
MNSWDNYGDECDSKIQMYLFVTIDVLGGVVEIGPSSRQKQPQVEQVCKFHLSFS